MAYLSALIRSFISTTRGDESGQGLVEYALILVLVAIVVIAVLTVLGPTIGQVFSDIAQNLDDPAAAPAPTPPPGEHCVPWPECEGPA